MYLELTPEDTKKDLQNMIIGSISGFEFPRKNISDYTLGTTRKRLANINPDEDFILSQDDETGIAIVDNSQFTVELTMEEVDIIATLMLEAWVQRQLTSIENTRMKYTGNDFKMTSQANHMAKLQALLLEIKHQSHHKQRLYKRRKQDEQGVYRSTWSMFKSEKF